MAVIDHVFPDSPTNTFATLNVLDAESATLSNGNLAATINAGPNNSTTIIPSSGTWYWEVYITDHTNIYMGIQKIETQESGYSQDAVAVNNVGNVYYDASYQNKDALPSIATGDIISVFWDIDNKKIWFAQNGQFYDATGTTHPTLTLSQVASGVNGYDYSSNIPNSAKPFFGSSATSAGIICNFGQDSSFGGNKTSGSANATDSGGIGDFYHSVPTGAKALCTSNIQSNLAIDPAVDDLPEDYFKCVKYNGVSTGGGNFAVPVGFQSDLIWIKRRNNGNSHNLFDSVRGFDKWIISDFSGAERNNTSNNSGNSKISTVNSSGFTVHDNHNAEVNDGTAGSASQYISWNWKAGGAPSGSNIYMKNDVGYTSSTSDKATVFGNASNYTITPASASINTKAGFSIIKYLSPDDSGGAVSTATVPHGLSAAPDFIICKNLDTSYNWDIYHSSVNYSGIFTTAAINSRNAFGTINSNIFTTKDTFTHHDDDEYIAYCFTSIPGFSAFGSYTGTNHQDKGYRSLDFKPSFILIKDVTSSGNWAMFDNQRGPINPIDHCLLADSAAVETTSTTSSGQNQIDFLSNGFFIRCDNANSKMGNVTGNTYLYAAFAEMPFKYSATNAR